jgi:hypothetical protein
VLDGDHVRYAGDYHTRERRPGGDVDICFRGQIAMTRLRLADPGTFAESHTTGLAEGGLPEP